MIKIAHLSDTHIGYEAYKATNTEGENQRSVDFAKSFALVVDDIISQDPDIVIHAGDVADRTHIPIRLMLFIRQQFQKLAAVRENGTRRQLIVVAGNHEIPRNKREACFLEMYKGLPGVHIVSRDYEIIKFNKENIFADKYPKILENLAVHCLPHEALRFVNFDEVQPIKSMKNILVSHGVAGGSELYLRSLGREYAIPTNVLARNWDYGALGHWHKQGPISILSAHGSKVSTITKEKQKGILKNSDRDENGFTNGVDYLKPSSDDTGKIWYSGSTENSGFGDLMDNGTKRGWLKVTLPKYTDVKVERRYLPIRAIFRLDDLDATNLSPDQITESLISNLKSSNSFGAVIGQIVKNVSTELWSLVDVNKVRRHASQALHYELTVNFETLAKSSGVSISTDSKMEDIINYSAQNLIPEDQRAEAIRTSLEIVNSVFEKNYNETLPIYEEGETN